MAYRLGVDLGTTFTAAAVANGAAPAMLGLGNRAMQVPSVLFLTEEGDFLVGEAAERRGMSEPDRLAREFKRRIGDHVPMLVAGAPFSPEILTAKVLSWAVRTATVQLGEPPRETIVTHPANWGPHKIELFEQMVALADIGSSRRCIEPVAAAARYAARARVDVGARLGVYDFGGGTFDSCVLEQTTEGFQLLGAPEGVEHLGGVDFDAALFQRVLGELGDTAADLDLDDPAVTHGLARLRRDVVEAKEALSADTTAVVPVNVPGLSRNVRITRAEFEAMIRPSVRTTIEAFARAVRSAGLTTSELSAIVLVGGSSRIPLVGELLQREFDVPVAVDTHPKHDVALGATMVDAQLAGPSPAATRPAPAPAAPPALPPEPEVEPEVDRGVEQAPSVPVERPLPPAVAPTRQRRRLIVAGLALTVVAGIVAGGIIANRSGTTAGPLSPTSSDPTPTSSETSPSVSPSVQIDPNLPRSAALTDTQMLLPQSFDGDQFHLYLGDAANGTAGGQLSRGDDSDFNAVMSPDRQSVVFVRGLRHPEGDQERVLEVMAVNGSRTRDLFSRTPSACGKSVSRPAWNPVDQTLLAVPCESRSGVWSLVLVHTDGSQVRVVDIASPGGTWRAGDPSFSADGSRLAFWAGSRDNGGAIYVADLSRDQQPRRLTSADQPGRDAYPTWTPDGKTLIFQRRVKMKTESENTDLYQIPADGSGSAEPFLTGPGDDEAPSWSPGANEIAYKSDAETPSFPGKPKIRVWIADSNGQNRRLLWTRGEIGVQGSPAWTRR